MDCFGLIVRQRFVITYTALYILFNWVLHGGF